MKSIIIDFHGGSISLLAKHLVRLGHEVSIFDVNPQDRLLDLNNLMSHRLQPAELREAKFRILRAGRFLRGTNLVRFAVSPIWNFAYPPFRFRAPKFDVAWVTFPPSFYRRVRISRVASQTVVFISHRMDLWISNPVLRWLFWRQLLLDLKNDRVKLIAATEFEAEYVHGIIGHRPEILRLPPARKESDRNQLEPKKDKWLIGPVNIPEEMARHVVELSGGRINLGTIRKEYDSYSMKDLEEHVGFICIPYSIYSISILELLSLGRPVLIPSNDWMLKNQTLDDVLLSPKYARAWENRLFYSLFIGKAKTLPHLSTNANLEPWLKFASWANHPNVRIWNDVDELISITRQISEDKEWRPYRFPDDLRASAILQSRLDLWLRK